jgi:chromate transporter
VALAFITPSFLVVLGLSALYVHYSGLIWIQGAFYGIGAAVIAIMALGVFKLSTRSIGRDRLLWGIALASLAVTAITETEYLGVFLGAGLLAVMIKTPQQKPPSVTPAIVLPVWLFTGMSAPADSALLWRILTFFAKSGAIVFGSGLAIVPFLHGSVVQDFGWLTEQQFIDAVAVAMITPGPVVITVAFIGYLVAGCAGAALAALGVFLPCYLFVVLLAPHFHTYSRRPRIKAFISGVTAAAIGAIGGAAFVLGRRAIIDVPTSAIFGLALILLIKFKRLPEPLLIGLAAVVGLCLKIL